MTHSMPCRTHGQSERTDEPAVCLSRSRRWPRGPTPPGVGVAPADLGLTVVVDGTSVKVMSPYDNEGGFTDQMVRSPPGLVGEVIR